MISQVENIDQKIVARLNSFFAERNFVILNKFFAEYLIYILPLILIFLWFYPVSLGASRGGSEKANKVALRAVFSVILAWPILAYMIGRLINRARPFEITGIKELVFHRPTYSFPSDHAATLFAAAFSFWLSGYKKLSVFVFATGIIVSFFRIATGIHYLTDILGGIVIGLLAAYLINLFEKPLDVVYNFIFKIFRIIRLA